jgi:histidyl-tRNA synthetase
MKKQMSYADRNGIPYVILVGEDEVATGKLKLKKMSSGEQYLLTPEEIVSKLS